MKVLSFAATNSRQSINKQLVSYATELLVERAGATISAEIIDLNDFEMPIYSIDREQESGIPEQAHRFFQLIREADAIVVSFAEHNGSFSAAYKNLYDWASRIDMRVYGDKPMVLLATSPGKGGASNVLRTAAESLPYFGAEIRGTFSLGDFYQQFDSEKGVLKDPAQRNELVAVLDRLEKNIAVAA